MGTTQDFYQSNADFKYYVDHWSWKHKVPVEEVLTYEITRLYMEQLLEKKEATKNEEIKYELHQDNGIT